MKTITPLLLAAIFFLAGCATKWETENEPTPFIAANQLAISQSRTVSDLTTMMNTTGERYECRWSDGDNIHIRKYEVMIEIEDYLLRTQYYNSLQKSGAHLVGYHEDLGTLNEKINKHRLYLVSLNPTVVLFVPIHCERPIELPTSIMKIQEVLGTPKDSVLGIHGLIESIYSGTEIPFDDPVLWCAPVVGGEPKLLEKNDLGQYQIQFNGCELVLTKTNNMLKVTRTK